MHGEVTFVQSGQDGSSLIDYVLASPDAMPLIQSVRVLPEAISDHLPVLLLIQRQAAHVEIHDVRPDR